jgi:hypothetical protein
MAHSESGFKSEFRKALADAYKDQCAIWTNNDMFACGLPDFSALWNPMHPDATHGMFFAIEAKFVKKIPARETSKVLLHDLSGIQAAFLEKVEKVDCKSVVLIGFEDIAVACPFDRWPRVESNGLRVPAANITLAQVMLLKQTGYAFVKTHSGWQVREFFQKMSGLR